MDSQVHIIAHKNFLKSYSKLQPSVQRKVDAFMEKFQRNPASAAIHLEPLDKCRDKQLRSARIDQTYRGILKQQKDTGTYVLLWVDHHDDAYDWARTAQCDVNDTTGAIQLYFPPDLDEISEQQSAAWLDEKPLLDAYSEKELLAIGVPKPMVPLARLIRSVQDFEACKTSFPDDTVAALELLVDGHPMEEVWTLIDMPPAGPVSNDLSKAARNPASQMSFAVIDSNEDLRRMLEAPLETWRVFLHPTQRAHVTRDYNGPACVLGGAGTGKTVVAIHRAKHLAGMADGSGRILVTTFTKNLTADLRSNLEKICTPEELAHIEVQNLDRWATDYLKENGSSPQIIYHSKSNDRLQKLWEKALKQTDAGDEFPVSFYEDEYSRVVLPGNINDLDAYLDAPRKGRGSRLSRQQRERIWRVFEEYRSLMQQGNVRDIESAMHECTILLSADPRNTGYRHVVVDETQDFSPNALQMIRAIAGEQHPNDLFLVGDSRQRIYKNKTVLSECGINVRGRSSELRVNYRTTAETRDFALALLEGVAFDDLDAGENRQAVCTSMTHGLPPQVTVYAGADQESDAVIAEIQRLITEEGVSDKNICVVSRVGTTYKGVMEKAKQKGLRCYDLSNADKADDQNYDGVRFATMHRVKGLEFEYVFILRANQGYIPNHKAIDNSSPQRLEESITAEKCLLHVAVTRAQKRAYISGYGTMSEFVQPMLKDKK